MLYSYHDIKNEVRELTDHTDLAVKVYVRC